MANICRPLSGLPKDLLLTNLVVNSNSVFRCKAVASQLQVRDRFQFAGGNIGDVLTNVGSDGKAAWLPPQGEPESIVTVGMLSSGADYISIVDACTAGYSIVRVITDITETVALDLTLCPHFRIDIDPGITINNMIAGAWVIGNNSLLKIVGSGAHMDLTTAGLSSQIILQTNQTFRSGINAELDVEDVRFSGSGINILLSGSSRISKCRFDGSTQFDLDLYDKTLFVDGCLFTVPVQLDSFTGADKSSIISNNLFDDGADITMISVTNMIFNGNTIGKTGPTNMTINGAFCDNVVISNNLFANGGLIISSSVAVSVTKISDNEWVTDGLLSITGTCNRVFINDNSGRMQTITIGNNMGGVFDVGSFNGNVFSAGGGGGNVIFSSPWMQSSVVGNNIGNISGGSTFGEFRFEENVNCTNISSNVAKLMVFDKTVIDTNIIGNCLFSNTNSLTISDTCTHVNINNNSLGTGNLILAEVVTSTICANSLQSITIDMANTGTTNNSSITGNVCTNAITIGALSMGMGGMGIFQNIISGNVAPSGTTTTFSNMINNIVTSNVNGGTTTGFGAFDVVANNV